MSHSKKFMNVIKELDEVKKYYSERMIKHFIDPVNIFDTYNNNDESLLMFEIIRSIDESFNKIDRIFKRCDKFCNCEHSSDYYDEYSNDDNNDNDKNNSENIDEDNKMVDEKSNSDCSDEDNDEDNDEVIERNKINTVNELVMLMFNEFKPLDYGYVKLVKYMGEFGLEYEDEYSNRYTVTVEKCT